METVKDIVSRWSSAGEFGRDINEFENTVRGWIRRNSIPGDRWAAICEAAQRRGIDGVTSEALAHVHDRRRETVSDGVAA